ncbi:rna-binding protein, partial [Vairimorpha apis BRL 01]
MEDGSNIEFNNKCENGYNIESNTELNINSNIELNNKLDINSNIEYNTSSITSNTNSNNSNINSNTNPNYNIQSNNLNIQSNNLNINPNYNLDIPNTINHFCKILRSRIRRSKLISLYQVGFDRVVVLQLSNYKLVIEFFSGGNIFILDDNDIILEVFRPVKGLDIVKNSVYVFNEVEFDFTYRCLCRVGVDEYLPFDLCVVDCVRDVMFDLVGIDLYKYVKGGDRGDYVKDGSRLDCGNECDKYVKDASRVDENKIESDIKNIKIG